MSPLDLPFGKYNLEAAKKILKRLPKEINAPTCDGFGDFEEHEWCKYKDNCDFLFELSFSEDEYFYYCTYACSKDEGMYAWFGVEEDAVKAVMDVVNWLIKEQWLDKGGYFENQSNTKAL